MSTLEQLPREIAAEILSNLHCSDLASTSRLSRRMNAISEPLLYKVPVLTNYGNDKPPCLQIFLRTLLSPGGGRLATYVQSINMERQPWTACHDKDPERSLEQSTDIALFKAAATPFGLRDDIGFQDSQIMLLLHYLPHLHALRIIPLDGSDDPSAGLFDEDIDPQIDNLPPGLQQLREFRCFSRDTDGGVSPNTFLTLLQLPCIRTIKVHITYEMGISLRSAAAAAGTSVVTDLRLTNGTLSLEPLQCILRIPIALTSFSYSAGSPHPDFDIGEALLPLRATLKFLRIEFMHLTEPIGSLREWAALRTLKCSLAVLLGKWQERESLRLVDVLPLGLRELDVRSDPYWSVDAALDQKMELLMEKETVRPELKVLAVGWGPKWWLDKLSLACEAAAVELKESESRWRDVGRQFPRTEGIFTPDMGHRRRQYLLGKH